ncbi:hypothetical protein O6H91_02G028700 [Diphasiastrum complanatum]|uniref:Uncharacterized protein n=2 Tax=Diphasiastrum complanatum TaxID=34168 RepID=A0ACC2EDL9_DIPCM|nr:hypothetical protein O6H91_02G028700 [Diphasiastrum complanatum]KAJ7564689.1 hypothetical protein O6H91_02G028700 [Diphasiastrum complanatum]
MSSGKIFHSRRHSWPLQEYVPRSTLNLLEHDPGAPPSKAWRRKLNLHANILKEFSVTFMEALKMIGLGFRLWSYVQAERSQGRTPPIDPFNRPNRPSACHGVPLGGMGGGSIGRGFRGEFRRWQLLPGVCAEAPVLANQFSVFVTRGKENGERKKISSVLSPGKPPELGKKGDNANKKGDSTGISSWDWTMDGQRSTYHALFPRAWTIYDGEPDPDLKISCRQVSPFIPNNYRESSFPVCVFSYVLINTGNEDANVSLLFTWANSIGGDSHTSGGHYNVPFVEEDGVRGVLLHHKTAKGNPPVTFAIAACESDDVTVTHCPCFLISGKGGGFTAKDLWMEMSENGSFYKRSWKAEPTTLSQSGSSMGAAVAASVVIPAHTKKTVTFALAWDSPEVKFTRGRSYRRRYTQFYGASGEAAPKLVHDALLGYREWEAKIEDWQNPILEDEKLPEWYRFTLFNELYYLVAGGTVWTDGGPPAQGKVDATIPDILSTTTSFRVNGFSSRTNSTTNLNDAATVGSSKIAYVDALQNQSIELAILDSDKSWPETINSNNHVDNRKAVTYGDEQPHIVFTASIATSSGLDVSENEEEISEKLLKAMQAANLDHDINSTSWDVPYGTSLLEKGEENVGQFLYLEGVEYFMWCTYDVHFYASFALVSLFPKLELSMQRDFAAATLIHNPKRIKFLAEGKRSAKKVFGAVPHDLGTYDPWVEVNAYNIHDTSRWKDLNSKFVLQIYRDVAATGDANFARAVWPAVYIAMAYMDRFDRDRDGMIENDGFPDQTYDTWTVHGISAYCGGLWLAALQAAAAMADLVNEKNAADYFRTKFCQARDVYTKKLWNGSYFNYDSGSSSNSNSIQADQMAGQWYAWASGLPPLFEDTKARSALQKIYDFNVMKVKGGRMGAVNGMHPNGKVDDTTLQSREVWSGVTYGVAAAMIHEGMLEQAFQTAEGVFLASWSEQGYGYWFQTPEAWTTDGHYRSLTYMRPLSIWAMQWALNPPKSLAEAPRFPSTRRGSTSYLHTGFSLVAEAVRTFPKPQIEKIRSLFHYLCGCLCRKKP